jgi:hypothetical protein
LWRREVCVQSLYSFRSYHPSYSSQSLQSPYPINPIRSRGKLRRGVVSPRISVRRSAY